MDNDHHTTSPVCVEYGVHGAYRISHRDFDNENDAVAFARRWARSNSVGDYWADVSRTGNNVATFNLPRPQFRSAVSDD